MWNTLLGVVVGFAFGIASWWLQQAWQRRELSRRVRSLLRLEYEQNVRAAQAWGKRVTDSVTNVHDIQKFHRLATDSPPVWQHLMWRSLAPSLAVALSEAEIRDAYAVDADWDALLRLQARVAAAFETELARELWKDFAEWLDLRRGSRSEDLDRATKEQREITRRCNTFVAPLYEDLNNFNAGYRRIHNPISEHPDIAQLTWYRRPLRWSRSRLHRKAVPTSA